MGTGWISGRIIDIDNSTFVELEEIFKEAEDTYLSKKESFIKLKRIRNDNLIEQNIFVCFKYRKHNQALVPEWKNLGQRWSSSMQRITSIAK